MALAAVGSWTLPIINSGLNGYIVAMIPNKKMGAIGAVMAIINMSTAPLAPLLAGVGLDTIGYRPTMLSFIVLLAIAVVIMAVNKEIRGIPKPGKWESYRAQAR